MKSKFGYEKNRIFDTSTIILWLVIVSGIIIRICYIPYNLPLSLDSIDYFAYGIAMSRLGSFPDAYLQSNVGWPSFLSLFFYLSNTSDILNLMNMQRTTSLLISVVTAIPLYFLCRVFFKKEIAILGTALFIFDPRIIENSTSGLTDPMFIFLTTSTILFVFYKNSRFFYLSFVFAALSSFVRYEGTLLVIPILFAYLLKLREDASSKKRLLVGVGLFLGITLSFNLMAYTHDSSFSTPVLILQGGDYIYKHIINNTPDQDDTVFGNNVENRMQLFLFNSITTFMKYLVWITIPISIIFVVIGLKNMAEKPTKNRLIFLMFGVSLSISSLYVYGRGIEETRYIYPLIPIIALIGCFSFDRIFRIINYKKTIFIILSAIIISSIVWTEYNKIDYQYEKEIFEVTLFVVDNVEGVNTYDGNRYVKVAELYKSWPNLLPLDDRHKMGRETKKISPIGYNSINDYIRESRGKGLTHLVVTENNNVKFLDQIFHDDKKYPFLIKVYDSTEHNFKNHIKVYKINFDYF